MATRTRIIMMMTTIANPRKTASSKEQNQPSSHPSEDLTDLSTHTTIPSILILTGDGNSIDISNGQ